MIHFEQLGPYRLGKKLGQGGMGSVFEGVDIDTQEAAAIKILSPTLAVEEGFRVRFEAEIESLKKLRHPNIVRLYGYGEQAGTLFYAMELVHGTSLEDELRAGRRFDWREVTQLAIKLCRALKHAHDHGVIHRDLKPANLLMTLDGDLKLSDFGIARLFGNTRMTSDGGVLGTAEYMAPEQADGRAVTERCDQYSLGGVLYALLAGRPPFRAKTLVEMLQLQRYAEPEPVTRFAPQTPAELARIVHQLLEKDPSNRFANTLILSRSLEAMERGLSISLSRDGDFVLGSPDPETPGTAASVDGALAPTLSPTQLAEAQQAGAGTNLGEIQATEATLAYAPAVEESRSAMPTGRGEPAAGRFTKVDEKSEQRTNDFSELLSGLLSPQTLGLVAALVLLVLAGWYLTRAPSAEELYRRIETTTADGETENLKRAQPDIAAFLDRYPSDPRGDKLRAMQDDVKQAHPVQRAYTEAKRTALVSPELAVTRFRALVDVYDDNEGNSSETARHYVRLAQQQLKQLQNRIDQHVADDRKIVEARLARAAELSAQNPPAARKIYAGVVELYSEKPWAADLVRQAELALGPLAEPRAALHAPANP